MLAEILPRAHARYTSLPVLGPYLDDFVVWLRAQGHPRLPICGRVRAARKLEALLQLHRSPELTHLCSPELTHPRADCPAQSAAHATPAEAPSA